MMDSLEFIASCDLEFGVYTKQIIKRRSMTN